MRILPAELYARLAKKELADGGLVVMVPSDCMLNGQCIGMEAPPSDATYCLGQGVLRIEPPSASVLRSAQGAAPFVTVTAALSMPKDFFPK